MNIATIRGRLIQVLIWPEWKLGRWQYIERGEQLHLFTGWLIGPIEIRVFRKRPSRPNPTVDSPGDWVFGEKKDD